MRFWGIWPPSKFYEASQDDIAFAIADYEEEMRLQAFQQELDRIEREQSGLGRNTE